MYCVFNALSHPSHSHTRTQITPLTRHARLLEVSTVISVLTLLPYHTITGLTANDFFLLWTVVSAYLIAVTIYLTWYITEGKTIAFYVFSFILKVILIYLHELSAMFPLVVTLAMAASISTIILYALYSSMHIHYFTFDSVNVLVVII